jgi:hypothetical protein
VLPLLSLASPLRKAPLLLRLDSVRWTQLSVRSS